MMMILLAVAVALGVFAILHLDRKPRSFSFSLITPRSDEMNQEGMIERAIEQAIEEMCRNPPLPGDKVAHKTIIRTCMFLYRDEDGMAVLHHPEMRHRRLRVPLDELYDPERVMEITARACVHAVCVS